MDKVAASASCGHSQLGEAGLMTKGIIWKQLLYLAVPLVIGNLLQQMYNTADSMIIGNFVGNNELAAVTSGSMLLNLLISFSQGLATGAGVVTAQYLGAGDMERSQKAVHTTFAVAIVIGVFLAIASVLMGPYLLTLMNTPSEIMETSVTYFRIYAIGLSCNVVYNMAAGIMNAVGRAKWALACLGVASASNVFLDLLFIRGMGWGVAGAAIATDISQLLSCVLVTYLFLRAPEAYRLDLQRFHFSKEMVCRIVAIGLPTGTQNILVWLSNVLIQSSVNILGVHAMAGFGAFLKVDGFNILPVLSIGMAITAFVGQNYGAKKPDRVRQGVGVALFMGVGYTVIAGAALWMSISFWLGLFTKDTEAVCLGAAAAAYFCPFYWINSVQHVFAGAIRGTGHTVPPMVILAISQCAFRIIWIHLACPYLPGLPGIYLLYPISWGIGAVLMVGYGLRQWKNVRTQARTTMYDADIHGI